MVNGLGVAGCFDVVQLPNRLFLSRKWRSSPAKNLEKNTAYLAFFRNIEGAGILIQFMFVVSHLNFNKPVMSPANLYFFSLEWLDISWNCLLINKIVIQNVFGE